MQPPHHKTRPAPSIYGERTSFGREFHEEPQILHYGDPDTGIELVPGMTFTVEPMINAGKRHIKLLSDGWTVVTKDHSISAQWEHTVLVTDTGHEILTLSPGATL